MNHRLTELHEKYGQVVRVAPDEISYTSDTAWKSIYGQRGVEMAKDPVFSLSKPSGAQGNYDPGLPLSRVLVALLVRLLTHENPILDLLTADRETHARQRRLMAHAFSEKALREQESILNLYASRLCEELQCNSRLGPVDMKDWYTFASR